MRVRFAFVFASVVVAACSKTPPSGTTKITPLPSTSGELPIEFPRRTPAATGSGANAFPLAQMENSATKPESLTLICTEATPGSNGRARISCSMSDLTASMAKPSAPLTDAQIAKMREDELADIAKKGDQFWRECAKGLVAPDPLAPDYERADLKRQRDACAKKDPNELIAATLASISDAANASAQTCKVGSMVYTLTLEQVDRDTWQETRGPEGACHVSSITTLTRDSANPGMWNYREVTTVANPGAPTCSNLQAVEVDEMRWDARATWQMDCKYLAWGL